MCGKIGHPGSKCPSGFVEMSKRPCFICGKGGHIGTNCPERGHQRSLKTCEEDDPHFSFCLDYFEEAGASCMKNLKDLKANLKDVIDTKGGGMDHKKACGRPTPKGFTVADFIVPVQNRFAKIDSDQNGYDTKGTGTANIDFKHGLRATIPTTSSTTTTSHNGNGTADKGDESTTISIINTDTNSAFSDFQCTDFSARMTRHRRDGTSRRSEALSQSADATFHH